MRLGRHRQQSVLRSWLGESSRYRRLDGNGARADCRWAVTQVTVTEMAAGVRFRAWATAAVLFCVSQGRSVLVEARAIVCHNSEWNCMGFTTPTSMIECTLAGWGIRRVCQRNDLDERFFIYLFTVYQIT